MCNILLHFPSVVESSISSRLQKQGSCDVIIIAQGMDALPNIWPFLLLAFLPVVSFLQASRQFSDLGLINLSKEMYYVGMDHVPYACIVVFILAEISQLVQINLDS